MHKAFGSFFEEANSKDTTSAQGGPVHKADDAIVFERFMILGSFGTYYADQKEVTALAIDRMNRFIAAEPEAAFEIASHVYRARLAFKRDPAILALAALTMPSVPLSTRKAAADFVGKMFVTGTDILHWASYRSQISGGKWNRLSRGVLKLYFERDRKDLELQAVKYAQRDGWALRDLMRLGHPEMYRAYDKTIADWITHPDKRAELDLSEHRLLSGARALTTNEGIASADEIIRAVRLPREAVPGDLLSRTDVWDALLNDMPAQALMRNLGKLSSLGLVDKRLGDVLTKIHQGTSKLHPMQFLVTWKQYATGRGERGNLTWTPNKEVVTALEVGYIKSFGNLTQFEGFKPLIALDVSGSMTSTAMGLNMSCVELEICLVEVLRHQFPDAEFGAFSSGGPSSRQTFRGFYGRDSKPTDDLLHMDVAGKSRVQIADMVNKYSYGFMGTDLRIPLNTAKNDRTIDAVITITDNEQGGSGMASDIVREIHNSGRENFKHAVVALALNDVTVADPEDTRQMDFAGASADLPRVLEYFLTKGFEKSTEPEWVSGDATAQESNRSGVSTENTGFDVPPVRFGIEVERGKVVWEATKPVAKKVDALDRDGV